MISYTVYKFIHFTGVVGLFLALGSIAAQRLASNESLHPSYRVFAISHGLSLFLLLLGGFGMLARLGIHWPWPGWLTVKLVLWVFFGAAIAVLKRKPEWSRQLWIALLVSGILAVYLGSFKPF